MKILFIFFALLISPLSFADAWDNLTLEEAEEVVAELAVNPYIFDNCDCCDHKGEYAAKVFLVKVTDTEIIRCEWNPEFYSVRLTFQVIAELKNGPSGPNAKKLRKAGSAEPSDILFMNYTWGLQPGTHIAVPFFSKIPYSTYGESKACKKAFNYPTPKAVRKVSDDPDYETWYLKAIA